MSADRSVVDATLAHLARLVAFDTRNPPRKIDAGGAFAYLGERFTACGCAVTITDHGAGAVSLFARRGTPSVLFNVHVDTVPDAPGWSHDPFVLHVEGDRAVGLGAADIKGAAAALLAAAEATTGSIAVLFSSDEEANDPRCIAGFLATDHGFRDVVVAEPTGCRAVLAHRGILSGIARFAGVAGHASEPRALHDNAIHRATAWSHAVLGDVARRAHDTFAELTGARFNIGTIHGGIKGNIIAPECEVRFNCRPLPLEPTEDIERWLRSRAPEGSLVDLTRTFLGPCLPAYPGDDNAATLSPEEALAAARALASRLGLEVGAAVDFWTEASLFSAAGLVALVYGPGHIAEAHGKDEWVALSELERAATHYRRLIQDGIV